MRAIPNGMRLANRSDEAIVINLMLKSFWNDPHFSWLAGYPTNNANKTLRFTALLKLMFAEMMIYNSVIITDDNDGCVFYKDSPRLRLSRDYVVACLRFAFAVGSTQIVRILKQEAYFAKQYPTSAFRYIWLLGVLPERQGQGLSSKLMRYLIDEAVVAHMPVYLETANPGNIAIYNKFGFKVYDTLQVNDGTPLTEIFLLKTD